MKRASYCLGLLAALSLPSAQAVNTEIRALFQPDPSQPNKNEFVNKTPNSGYCATYPAECAHNNVFSIRIPLRFDSTRALVPGEILGMKVPANWRQLTVTHRDTQETKTLEVRIVGIGSQYHLSDTAANLTGAANALDGHRRLWTGSSWVNPGPPCGYSGFGYYGPNWYGFFWRTPVEAACTKITAFQIPSMFFHTLDFAYELRTPNPLGMSSGLYTGSLVYSLGPNGDFQMGSMMVPNDDNLTLDFVLDVQHTLKVDIPPGGNKVALEPQGGWQGWLQRNRRPERLFRDQTFLLSASSRFKMQLECQYSDPGNTCSLYEPVSGHAVPLSIAVTLPPGMTDASGQPVNRRPLLLDGTGTELFMPGLYLDRKPATLHFEIGRKEVEEMLSRGGKTYAANVTVVWDSEI